MLGGKRFFMAQQQSNYKAWDYIKSDCYRYCGKSDCTTMFGLYVRNKTFRWQIAFRLCHSRGILRLLGRILWRLSPLRRHIQIHRDTQIGYGFYIGHGGPVVVNASAVIGNNCNISQFTTIGSNHEHAAIIGDNVYIGPSVCIVEDVKIGDNVTIGAGSIVTKDIPAGATVAGNYAKILNFDNPGRYVQSRWPV